MNSICRTETERELAAGPAPQDMGQKNDFVVWLQLQPQQKRIYEVAHHTPHLQPFRIAASVNSSTLSTRHDEDKNHFRTACLQCLLQKQMSANSLEYRLVQFWAWVKSQGSLCRPS